MASVHIFQRGKSWYAGVTLPGRKKVQVSLKFHGGETDRDHALAAAHTLYAEWLTAQAAGRDPYADWQRAKDGTPVFAAHRTVAQWWDEFDATFGAFRPDGGVKSASSLANQARTKRHWLPLIGAIPLADLTPLDLARAQHIRRHATCEREPAKQMQESSIGLETRHVKALLNKAVALRLIPTNPFVGAPKLTSNSRAHRILTEQDEATLFALPESMFPSRWRRLIRFLLLTGLRRDELLNQHFTELPNARVRVLGKGQRVREVALVTEAREILAAQRLDEGSPRGPRPQGNTRPWWHSPESVGSYLARLADRAGIPHFSPHDLRHTFGHRWLKAGRDLKLLSLILGHKSVAVTERHYAYLSLSDVSDRMLAVMEPDGDRG